MNKTPIQLTVWMSSMPESNGKSNWTVILHRVGETDLSKGITQHRSEYEGRARYAADELRFLLGELEKEPCVLDYDTDTHSGYRKPEPEPWNITDQDIDRICSPDRQLRWKEDGRQYDRDTVRKVVQELDLIPRRHCS